MDWRESNGVRWLESRLPGASVAFSTRAGGVSEGPFESLNLGFLTDDEGASVVENRARLCQALGLEPRRVVIGRQVHGAEIAVHDGPQDPSPFAMPGSPLPERDGHVIRGQGAAALVFVADCLPVALSGPGGLAMLHCGWRGMAAGLIAGGAAAVGATAASVGPGIGPCCYKVGAEVLTEFSDLGEGVADGGMLDLTAVARGLLERAGVTELEVAGLCTSCEQETFFSHRRDRGTTGRQAGVAWLDGEPEPWPS